MALIYVAPSEPRQIELNVYLRRMCYSGIFIEPNYSIVFKESSIYDGTN